MPKRIREYAIFKMYPRNPELWESYQSKQAALEAWCRDYRNVKGTAQDFSVAVITTRFLACTTRKIKVKKDL